MTGLSSNVQNYRDKYYTSVGMQGDDLDSLISSARDKGINIVSGSQAAFDPMRVELSSKQNQYRSKRANQIVIYPQFPTLLQICNLKFN